MVKRYITSQSKFTITAALVVFQVKPYVSGLLHDPTFLNIERLHLNITWARRRREYGRPQGSSSRGRDGRNNGSAPFPLSWRSSNTARGSGCNRGIPAVLRLRLRRWACRYPARCSDRGKQNGQGIPFPPPAKRWWGTYGIPPHRRRSPWDWNPSK